MTVGMRARMRVGMRVRMRVTLGMRVTVGMRASSHNINTVDNKINDLRKCQ